MSVQRAARLSVCCEINLRTAPTVFAEWHTHCVAGSQASQKAAKTIKKAVDRLEAAEAVVAEAAAAEALVEGADIEDEALVQNAHSLDELRDRVSTGTVLALATASGNPQSLAIDPNGLSSLGKVTLLAIHSPVCDAVQTVMRVWFAL